MKPLKTSGKRGVGLYTNEQAKNTTPFQYFAQIVVGTIVASLGVILGYDQYQTLSRRSTWGIVIPVAFVVIGIFFTHAGAIFWYRQLRKL